MSKCIDPFAGMSAQELEQFERELVMHNAWVAECEAYARIEAHQQWIFENFGDFQNYMDHLRNHVARQEVSND